jgi:hypothetical protein
MHMAPERKPQAKSPSAPPLKAEIPDDVRAELERDRLAPVAGAPPALPVEPIPDDVLAERDAEVRAAQQSAVDADLRPIALDEDSER